MQQPNQIYGKVASGIDVLHRSAFILSMFGATPSGTFMTIICDAPSGILKQCDCIPLHRGVMNTDHILWNCFHMLPSFFPTTDENLTVLILCTCAPLHSCCFEFMPSTNLTVALAHGGRVGRERESKGKARLLICSPLWTSCSSKNAKDYSNLKRMTSK